jgi:iron complex transport system substrate-binding protein
MVRLLRSSLCRAALAAALLLLPQAALAAQITDAAGRSVEVRNTDRIVSLGGDVTEILYALGAGDRVVAVDTTSLFPAEARQKPNVGYLRALSAEGVLALKPGLVLAAADAGPPTAVQVLESASVPFVLVPKGESAQGVAEKIRFVAKVIGAEARGEVLAAEAERSFASLGQRLAGATKPRAMFVLSLNGGRPIVAGSETGAQAAIELAGAENPFGGMKGYKPVSDEAIVAAAPEAIVVMTRSSHMPSPEEVFSLPAFAGTPAGQGKRLITVDALSTLAFGPRAPAAIAELARKLHPDLTIPPIGSAAAQ